ncbi:hypothetical protein AWB79_03243 [Caballeronia hypogeia]|uniref:Uncharacterized protein n=2 Tax=Caballeronia hypogeia TaxID=1777140 RepID=A0A158B6A3_9BURK|nr:hypothetical protein AWB79_03243 [Caballeronia hypogeia]
MGRAGPNLPVKDLGLIGVMVVFSISGYLVTKSWDN